MNCPICNSVSLVMSERQGIEIDYCPQCRGVWLDRGELDKIIERSLSTAPAPAAVAPQPAHYPNQNSHSQGHHSQGHHSQSHHAPQHGGYYKKKKREGFLSELFDFD
jgi:Zn-finger nucleic acid-binding protein